MWCARQDECCFVPKFAVNDPSGKEILRARSDVCCGGCCVKCVFGQQGGRCCAIPFKLRDPATLEPVGDAELTELWAGMKKACCQCAPSPRPFRAPSLAC